MNASAGRKALLALVLAFLALSPVRAQDRGFRGLEFFYDSLWQGNSDTDSAPSPILGVWGAGAAFHLGSGFYLLPEIGFYGIEYFYRDGKALPAEIEYADAVGTLGILADGLLAYRFPLAAEKWALKLGTGPALSFKLPLVRHGDAPASEVASYFMEKLRFLHWEVKAAFEFDFSRSLGFTFRLRTLLPIYRIWDPAPFYDGLMAGAGIGIRKRF